MKKLIVTAAVLAAAAYGLWHEWSVAVEESWQE